MDEAAVAVDAPAVQDESIQALNARLPTFVDQTLGFGVLEDTTKQQLRVLSASPPFCPYARTTTEFKSVENTATLKGAMDWEQITRTVPVAVEVAAQNRMKTEWRAVRAESVVVFHFKRIIAMRSMPIPRFCDLLPVQKRAHLERDKPRWLVELYGNHICTTEYYGGEASIAFRWNHDANVSTARVMSAIQTAVADARGSREAIQTSQMSGFWCRADVKGFKVPDRIQGNLTTMVGVMELIRELSKLPIECAVPVSRDTVRIQMVSGFPPSIRVETHIRENEILEKLTQVELQIGKTEPLNDRAFDFVKHLKHTVEGASMCNRPALPQLRVLANTVAETLAQHGKRVELYERYDELRLHTDNCDAKGVTASASETLSALTLGLATLGVRYHQSMHFEASPVWTVPDHYKADSFTQTYAVCGYYNRVKKLLCFNDNALLDTWCLQIDQLLTQTQVAAGPPSLKKAMLGFFS